METKVNYVIVGLFGLLLSAAMIAGVLWLSAGKQYNTDYDTYVAYMNESVSGLNLNAPVKYRGVEVGQVRHIALDKNNLEQVRLELAIEHGVTIKADTIAILKSQGLTGIAYIELSGGSSASPVLEAKKQSPYPVIKTGPSLLGRLDVAMTSLLNNLNKTTENMNAIMDEGNRKALKQTMADIAQVSGTLVNRKGDLDKTLENFAQSSTQLPGLIERIAKSTAAVEKMANETSRASMSVRKTFDDIGPGAKRISGVGLQELERMMAEMRKLSESLRRITEQIEQDPSLLLRGKEARKRGPGE